MELSLKQIGNKIKMEIKGNINEKGAEEIKTRFRELNISMVKQVVIDFRGVSHIGSAGIGKLLLIYKDLAICGGTVEIENVSQTVFDLFKTLKLDTIFTITKA